ncbi:MAG: iron-containing alcohol dehydrogenase [Paracoccaceae bacterium]
MDLLSAQDWTFPVPITYGPGRVAEIGAIAIRAGMTNPLVVTDQGSRDLPFIAEIQGHLRAAGLSSGLHAKIAPNPRDEEIAKGRALYRQGGHDGIIAVGGGSGMDGAKAITLTVNNDQPLETFEYRNTPAQLTATDFPPLITVPTTAGTGAETESTAMITDTARGMKFCFWHPECKPACALLDPGLTVGLPRNLTAWTGMDALVHAIEAYLVPDFHPLCDGAALEGLRLIRRHLPRAVEAPDDMEARGAMLVGSSLAGIAFLKGLGLVHAISHMVGAEFDTHHGLTNAVLLPSVMRFNEPAMGDKVLPLADAMGLEDRTFNGIYADICGLCDQLEIPVTLADLGVTPDRVNGLADKAAEDIAAETNVRIATIPELRTLIETGLSHGR